MKPAAAATRRKAAASTKKPGQALPSKTSSASSQATPSITKIRARKAKTPAAMPTTEPRRILPTFSEISVLASSISSRTSEELFSATSKTSSETERSSCVGRCGEPLPGGGVPVPSATLLGRILVVDAAEDEGGEARRGNAGQGAAGGEHAAPGEALDDVVLHGLDLTYRSSRPSQIVVTSKVFASSKSLSAAGITSKIQPESSCSTAP